MTRHHNIIDTFDFSPGRIFKGKYQIESRLGAGWEGEVYLLKELDTGIERAAKFFFPQRNINDKTASRYAKKLHRLRDCPYVIHYHTREQIIFHRTPITCLISDYVEGILLPDFLSKQRGKRIAVFQGLHLLHALAVLVESIHRHREYHGDLHSENVIIRRCGLGFDLKVLDLFHWGKVTRENQQGDICDIIRIFYDSVGGQKFYSKHPKTVKDICCGLKRSLILKKFGTATKLREHLETLAWSD